MAWVGIGNDVVDLEEAFNRTAHLRPRFAERVLSPAEQHRVGCSFDPNRLLWKLFAAKEAAYKVVARSEPGLPFAHARFIVASDLDSVEYGGEVLWLRMSDGPGWVHAIAGGTSTRVLQVGVEQQAAGADEREEARGALARALAQRLGGAPSEYSVMRPPEPARWDGLGAPLALRDGKELPLDVSLSHDGRFVAYAAAERPGADLLAERARPFDGTVFALHQGHELLATHECRTGVRPGGRAR